MTRKNAVATAGSNLPANILGDMAAAARAGRAQHAEDMAIPFLVILQTGSPQVKRGQPEYIKEAESSMIMNSVTKELFDGEEGITVIPCAFEKVYIEWKDREKGGGIVMVHDRVRGAELETKAKRNDKGQAVLDNGNIIVGTAQHYVLILRKDGTVDQALIAMSSTQLKKSRQWNTIMAKVMIPVGDKKVPAPSFACKYQLTTVAESNAKGDWFGWKIEHLGGKDPAFLQDGERALFQMAKAFYEAIMGGAVKVSDRVDDHGAAAAPSSEKTAKVM